MSDSTPGHGPLSASTTTPGAATGPDPAPGRAVPEPVEVDHVIVPLDGSPFSERALPVASWLADGLGADVHLVQVALPGEEAEGAIRYLDTVGRRHQAAAWDVVEREEVAEALAEVVAARPGRLACLATHGRDRSATLLGSVAAALLARSTAPAVVVGPEARAVTAADAPVVVAVDGTTRDDALLPVALGWAVRLGRRLEIVTVAEPVPPGFRDGRPPQRAHGPDDPEAYVASLVARAEGRGVGVASQVAYDPVSVRDALVPLVDRTAALVVLGTRRRTGLPRMVLGSHAARIVHDARVPALVVPWHGE